MLRMHWAVFAISLLVACTQSGEGDATLSTSTATDNAATKDATIRRASMGNITFIDAGSGVQSIIETDAGYQFTITGKFEEGVRVGDWVEVIFTNGTGEDGTRYLCTKYTDRCREIRAMHTISTEIPQVTDH